MKGYVYNNTCYIFPNQDAAAIPEQQGVTEYLIQYDELDAYKEINTTLADKLFGYNYNSMTVNAKPWKDHENDELHRPGPVQLTLTYADGCEQYIKEDYRYNSVENNVTTDLLAPDDMDNKFFDWNDVHKYNASYTGGTCNFRDLNWLELHTAVEDPEVTTVELSIVPKNYACTDGSSHDKVVIVDTDEETKVFVTDQIYTLVEWGQGYYRYTATLDGNAITCNPVYDDSGETPILTIWNEDSTAYYMILTVKDFAEHLVEVNPATTGTFVFTQVPENSITYYGEEYLQDPAQSAYEGDTVTLTAASGYTSTNLILTSDDVQLTAASTTTWTFTMPATGVAITIEALQNSASLDDQTGAITINLVDANVFHSDAVAGLFVESPAYSVTLNSEAVNDPTANVTDDGDPDNPQVVSVEYGDGGGEIWFTITYDEDALNYVITPNDQYSGTLAGTYVFTPIQL